MMLLIPALQIVWIDLLLSGDNAVVIALACRSLPPRLRMTGTVLGTGVAVLLRIAFTLIVAQLIALPWLKAIGGLMLLWIAAKLVLSDDQDEAAIKGHSSLWRAIGTIAIADAVMSLDNVVAIAAAAKGNQALIIFGLLISIPLVIAGSALLIRLIARFPILVWAGAALLGWIGGDIFAADSGITGALGFPLPEWPFAVAGATFVLAAGYAVKRRKASRACLSA